METQNNHVPNNENSISEKELLYLQKFVGSLRKLIRTTNDLNQVRKHILQTPEYWEKIDTI